MPATDSLIGTANVVTTTAATLQNKYGSAGGKLFTRVGGWEVAVTPAGMTITKASSFGGTQNTFPTTPISLDDARELATAILEMV